MHTLALAQTHAEAAPFDSFAPTPFAARAIPDARAGKAVASLMRALAERYPVVCRLAGEQSFFGAARGFVFTQPPRSANLLQYGETFPRFLRSLGNSASIDYLADIAELESARHKARYALHAAPIDIAPLSSQSAERLQASRILLHPSVSLVASRFPIVTVWEANRSDGEPPMIERWNAEAALVARPFLSVDIRRLPPGGHAFLRALLNGSTIADAAAAGDADDPDFDVAANLAVLAESNAIIDIR
jgi:Putative DNA-binding domain